MLGMTRGFSPTSDHRRRLNLGHFAKSNHIGYARQKNGAYGGWQRSQHRGPLTEDRLPRSGWMTTLRAIASGIRAWRGHEVEDTTMRDRHIVICVLPLVLLLVMSGCGGNGGSGSTGPSAETPLAPFVVIESSELVAIGTQCSARGTVRNDSTTDAFQVFLRFAARDAQGQVIGEGLGMVLVVQPGQRMDYGTLSFATRTPSGMNQRFLRCDEIASIEDSGSFRMPA